MAGVDANDLLAQEDFTKRTSYIRMVSLAGPTVGDSNLITHVEIKDNGRPSRTGTKVY
jgi:hypothetical protein